VQSLLQKPFSLSLKTENYKLNKNGDVRAYTRNTVARSRNQCYREKAVLHILSVCL